MPPQIDERACFDAIALEKDVDGVTCLGFGRMAMGEEAYGSATPQGIMRLLEANDVELAGKHAVVVGRSPILGKPMAMMLLNANATVTVCHSRTNRSGQLSSRKRTLWLAPLASQNLSRPTGSRMERSLWTPATIPGGVGDIELAPLADQGGGADPGTRRRGPDDH